MTKPISPVEVAQRAGAHGSSWHQVGDGPWSGTVFLRGDRELAVEQLTSGWKVTDETGKTSSGRELEPLLRKAMTT